MPSHGAQFWGAAPAAPHPRAPLIIMGLSRDHLQSFSLFWFSFKHFSFLSWGVQDLRSQRLLVCGASFWIGPLCLDEGAVPLLFGANLTPLQKQGDPPGGMW